MNGLSVSHALLLSERTVAAAKWEQLCSTLVTALYQQVTTERPPGSRVVSTELALARTHSLYRIRLTITVSLITPK